MKLENIFDFFQHRMKRVLKQYLWKFVLIYIDDIIIFSSTFENHLIHFDEILILLKKSKVTLFLSKFHFVYLNIKVLSYYVFKLSINMMKKKVEIIKNLKFLNFLWKLETDLKFFEYYREFVFWYSFIEKSLVKLKIRIFKNALRKRKQRFQWALKIHIN
jgi:hypothetical protein